MIANFIRPAYGFVVFDAETFRNLIVERVGDFCFGQTNLEWVIRLVQNSAAHRLTFSLFFGLEVSGHFFHSVSYWKTS